MSLDMGEGISSIDAHAENSEAVEEDYCLNAAERFRQQWMQHGTFQPAALRHYGVRGDLTLMRSLLQSRSFGATYGTFSLGDHRDFEPQPAPVVVAGGGGAHVDPNAAVMRNSYVAARGINGDFDVPMGAVLLGPAADPQRRSQFSPEEMKGMQDELARSWVTLSQPSEWCQAMCGVVTVSNWVTVEQRQRARHQLQLAAFMGVRAVQIPLPMLLGGRWQATPDDASWTRTGGLTGSPEVLSAEAYNERNWQLLAEVAETLAAFLRDSDAGPKVWIRCDACYPLQRRQFHALRNLVVYGVQRDSKTGRALGPRFVTTNTACESTRRETIHALTPLLFFSNPYALSSFSSEWLGEDVAVFEVPPADLMLRCILSTQPASPGADGEGSTTSYDYGLAVPLNDSVQQQPEMLSENPTYTSLLQGTDGEEGGELNPTPRLEDSQPFGDGAAPVAQETPAESPKSDRKRRAAGRSASHVWQLPADLLSRTASRWGGHYPARVSLVTLVVELMRRRASPLFSQFFFDHYKIMNFLYFAAVADHARDNFAGYENVLQLPLQPLGHQLSSGVYEVFERDASKYRQYREAFYAFTLDWVNAPPATHHHGTRCASFARRTTPAPPSAEAQGGGEGKETLYVVLLGSGRGPLIDEILSAASSLGVQVRLFALEKNGPAAAFTELRWRCDPEWQHLADAFGHTLTTIVADARTIFDKQHELALPADFGLCDVIVSELLGSFGDNELSPECIEGFVAQLKACQAERASQGLSFNPHMECIPQSYTAWAAPVHSVHLEQAVTDAAIKGLTVRPEGCTDRHAALFHSLFVCNLTRGMALAPPQPCWTFHHHWDTAEAGSKPKDKAGKKAGKAGGSASSSTHSTSASAAPGTSGEYDFSRHVSLTFEVPPQGRCSGFAGFFSCVLYTPKNPAGGAVVTSPVTVNEGRASGAITMSTVPVFSTRALVDGRTPDMYSWFPCFFPIDPSRVRDLPCGDNHLAVAVTNSGGVDAQAQSKSATVTITLDLSRHLDVAAKKMWYTWSVGYGDGPSAAKAASTSKDPVERRLLISNEKGWASTMLL